MRKNDYLLLLFILLLASFTFFIRQNAPLNNSFLVVKLGEKTIKTVVLTKKPSTLNLKTEHGVVQIEIKDKQARIISSPCKDKLCLKQGFISKPGETIVCLPEKVLLTIKTTKEETPSSLKGETIDAVLK
jgi:hypothetical protein